MRGVYAVAIVALLLPISCIHEQRGGCPTYMTLDLSSIPESVENLHMILEYEGRGIYADTIYREEFGGVYERAVPKGSANMAIFGNISNMRYEEGYVTLPGLPLDDIYTYFTKIEIRDDLMNERITLLKNHIGVHIRICEPSEADDSGINMEIMGSTVGYDNEGTPVNGEFYHSPLPNHIPTEDEGYYIFETRLPRLTPEDDFSLKISSASDGVTVALIPILEKIAQSGYDLTSSELEDLYIEIDISRSAIKISAEGFNSIFHVETTF
jgi:hypothetical protein